MLNILVAGSFLPIVIDRKLLELKVTLFYKIAVFLDSSKMHQFAFGQMKWKCPRYAKHCAVVATVSCTSNIYGQIEWVSPANDEYCHHFAACK